MGLRKGSWAYLAAFLVEGLRSQEAGRHSQAVASREEERRSHSAAWACQAEEQRIQQAQSPGVRCIRLHWAVDGREPLRRRAEAGAVLAAAAELVEGRRCSPVRGSGRMRSVSAARTPTAGPWLPGRTVHWR